jgi:two-component system, LuxR family, sensor kinase FixL
MPLPNDQHSKRNGREGLKPAGGNLRHLWEKLTMLVAGYRRAGQAAPPVVVKDNDTRRRLAEEALFESEARQRLISDSVVEVICQFDPGTGRFSYVSPSVQRLLGYTQAQVLGKTVVEFMPADSRQKALASLRGRIADIRRLRADASSYQDELVLRGNDDSTVAVEVMSAFLRNKEGRLNILAVVRDLSERSQRESEVLRRIELEQERIGRDLHDGLCQILVATKYHGALLAKKLREENLPWALGELNYIEQALSQAIVQTRDMAKGLNPVRLESNGLVCALSDLAEFIQTTSHAQCQCQNLATMPIPTGEVARQLYRITQEALQNALKHGKARNIFIVLKNDAEMLRLMVVDDGVGLPDDHENSPGSGRRNMMTRAAMIGGTFELRRGARGGCVAEVHWPVTAAPPA